MRRARAEDSAASRVNSDVSGANATDTGFSSYSGGGGSRGAPKRPRLAETSGVDATGTPRSYVATPPRAPPRARDDFDLPSSSDESTDIDESEVGAAGAGAGGDVGVHSLASPASAMGGAGGAILSGSVASPSLDGAGDGDEVDYKSAAPKDGASLDLGSDEIEKEVSLLPDNALTAAVQEQLDSDSDLDSGEEDEDLLTYDKDKKTEMIPVPLTRVGIQARLDAVGFKSKPFWFQLKALARLLAMEEGAGRWRRLTTDVLGRQGTRYERRGMILAFACGLGKTVVTLALTALDMEWEPFPGPTLIVSPLNVATQWKSEALRHCGHVTETNVLLYHGNRRKGITVKKLNKFKLVITTYETLLTEYRKIVPKAASNKVAAKLMRIKTERARSPLMAMKWRRVVLDEAHLIRNHATGRFRASLALDSKRRHCLTGTPFNNTVEDVTNLCRFQLMRPYCTDDWAKTVLPKKRTKEIEVWRRDQLILRSDSVLRRIMGPKTEIEVPYVMSRGQGLVYAFVGAVVRSSMARFEALTKTLQEEELAANKARFIAFANVLLALLRIRQVATSPAVMLGRHRTARMADLPEAVIRRIDSAREKTEAGGGERCNICSRTVESARTLGDIIRAAGGQFRDMSLRQHKGCRHWTCDDCSRSTRQFMVENAAALKNELGIAPIAEMDSYEATDTKPGKTTPTGSTAEPDCKPFANGTKLSTPSLEAVSDVDKDDRCAFCHLCEPFAEKPTAKILSVVEAVVKSVDSEQSVVVFSAYSAVLDLIATVLNSKGLGHIRLDGDVKIEDRDYVVDRFQNPRNGDHRILLCTTGCGGVGLNLTTGRVVCIVEPLYNPMAERQAVKRIHRIGQEKSVQLLRFIASDSVERDVQRVQLSKLRSATVVLGNDAVPHSLLESLEESTREDGAGLNVAQARSMAESIQAHSERLLAAARGAVAGAGAGAGYPAGAAGAACAAAEPAAGGAGGPQHTMGHGAGAPDDPHSYVYGAGLQ